MLLLATGCSSAMLLLSVTAGPPAWYGLHGDRDAELRSVAANSPPHWQVGGMCAEHFAVNFMTRGAAPWWSGNTTGDTVCNILHKAPCSQVMDWQGHTHKCSEMCQGSRMAMCGESRVPKRCMLCSGECGACPTPNPPPPPGVKPTPNWQGCTTALAKALPYCDATKSIDERVDWLVANLTLAEKIRAISPQPDLGDACGVHTCGKPSIGLPNYFWLTETNTGVAAKCYTADPSDPFHCAVTFVGPMNMGASFNRTSWHAKGDVLGTEMRAFNNLAWMRSNEANLIGLTGFGPNVSPFRLCTLRLRAHLCWHPGTALIICCGRSTSRATLGLAGSRSCPQRTLCTAASTAAR